MVELDAIYISNSQVFIGEISLRKMEIKLLGSNLYLCVYFNFDALLYQFEIYDSLKDFYIFHQLVNADRINWNKI